MADYGIKVSKAGYNVNTASNKDLILTSQYPFLKAYAQGSFSLSITGPGTYTTNIYHNFGYFPVFLHYGEVDPANPARRYFGRFSASSPYGVIAIDSYTTTTTLTIGWRDTSASPGYFATYPYTVYFYYYLFYDELG